MPGASPEPLPEPEALVLLCPLLSQLVSVIACLVLTHFDQVESRQLPQWSSQQVQTGCWSSHYS